MATKKRVRLTMGRQKIKTAPDNAVRTIANAAAFLAVKSEGWSDRAACEEIGIARSSFYKWLREDEQFAEMYQMALEDRADVVRDEVFRRGVKGWLEPVYQGGERVGTIRKFSDKALELEAKAVDPVRYGGKAEPITPGSGGASILGLHIHMTLEEAREKMRELGLPDRILLA